MLSLRLAQSLGSLACGYLVSYVDRSVCICFASVIFYLLIAAMWYPTGGIETVPILMVISGLWGLAQAFYNIITNSEFASSSSCRFPVSLGLYHLGIYGQLHSSSRMSEMITDETNTKVIPTGFSNYSLWKYGGSFVMASLAPLLMVQVILLILTCILTIAIISYVTIELHLRGHLKPRQQYTSLQ